MPQTPTSLGGLELSASLLTEMILKGSLLVGVVWLVTRWLSRAPASSRHLLWSGTMVALLVLPVLALTLPVCFDPIVAPVLPAKPTTPISDSLMEPDSTARLPYSEEPVAEVITIPAPPLVVGDAVEGASVPPLPDAWREVTSSPLGYWLLIIWAVGFVLCLLPMVGGFLSLWVVARRSTRVRSGPIYDLLQELRARLGICRNVRLLLCDRRRMPMTWGLWRPVVLLPSEATDWPEERLRSVLVHELAHVQRCDFATQLVARVARAVHWLNPLVWFAFARLAGEQEAACDDAVLRTGEPAADYAEHLLTLSVRCPGHTPLATVGMSSRGSVRLENRLRAILDPNRNSRTMRGLEIIGLCLTSTLLLLGLGLPRVYLLSATETPDAPRIENVRKERDRVLVERALRMILEHHVDPRGKPHLAEDAIRGMMRGLGDRYSEFLDEANLAKIQRSFSQKLTGVGIWLKEDDGSIVILSPIDGSPAAKSLRIQPGDILLAVDGKLVGGRDLWENVGLIMGPIGTKVTLRVRHTDGKEEDVELERQRFDMSSVHGFRRGPKGEWDYFLDPEKTVAYISLMRYSSRTASDIQQLVEKLIEEGMEGLVLDLRDTPGGLLEAALEVADLFLEEGVIVEIRTKKGKGRKRLATKPGTLAKFPLVVLVNEHTASASEVVVGALKDNGRAVVLGTRTHGKGSIQSIFELDGSPGALKLTTAYYFSPSGRNIARRAGNPIWGVDPTDGQYVPMTSEQVVAARKNHSALQAIHPGKVRPENPALTPEIIEKTYCDLQLGGATRAMKGRLETGKFPKVGRSISSMMALILRKEQLEEHQKELKKALDELREEMKDLDRMLEKGDKEASD